ncbi:MAG: sigma-70 family RNA polymerase sigma factor [Acidobacteriota bacterium]|nr:sigma-70 family RNA polymerase sigma factor [Acidobacteriota bacterium]
MLAEKEAYMVAGLDEFVSAEKTAEHETPRVAQPCLYESKLIARMKAGEMSAFDELVEEYQPLVYALSFRILGDAEDARDAAQETFLKIYRHFERFRGESSLKTWICRIAINQARSSERWWRRRFRKATSSLDSPLGLSDDDRTLGETLESDAVSPEIETLSRERGRCIEQGLSEVKKDFRIAVILRDIEGLSYEEIAYVTEVSVGTVKSRIARGREMLREIVQSGEKGAAQVLSR